MPGTEDLAVNQKVTTSCTVDLTVGKTDNQDRG